MEDINDTVYWLQDKVSDLQMDFDRLKEDWENTDDFVHALLSKWYEGKTGKKILYYKMARTTNSITLFSERGRDVCSQTFCLDGVLEEILGKA